MNSNPSTIRQRDARLDIRARGFWECRQSTFFDVRVFHPNAPSYRCSPLPTTHRRHKKREYADRVLQIEQGSFTPLVLSSAGGMGDYFLHETCQPHPCSAYVRGSRNRRHYAPLSHGLNLVVQEGRVPCKCPHPPSLH